MKLKFGEQTRIAKETKLAKSTICDTLAGRIRAPFTLAAYFERTYGIDRRSWYWPDEFPNPLLRKQQLLEG